MSSEQNAAHESPMENAESMHTRRQQEVLSAVLALMVEEGDAFSMASVAARASCSKETLYRWYGDRDGLLVATVKWQASKVTLPEFSNEGFDAAQYQNVLTAFAKNWLTVITGEVSIALNRMAITHAGSSKSNLGAIVLENGPLEMKRRLEPVFLQAGKVGHCSLPPDEAFPLFFGLVVADSQIRALLGDLDRPSHGQINKRAEQAVERFLTLSCKPQSIQNA